MSFNKKDFFFKKQVFVTFSEQAYDKSLYTTTLRFISFKLKQSKQKKKKTDCTNYSTVHTLESAYVYHVYFLSPHVNVEKNNNIHILG